MKIKFKVYGIFWALFYSFFLNTINHRDGFIFEKKVFIESQIKNIDHEVEDEAIIKIDINNNNFFIAEVRDTPPEKNSFSFDKNQRKEEVSIRKIKKNWSYKGIALEKDRVLRI